MSAKKFSNAFTFGGTTAEKDPLFHDAYVDTGTFDALVAHDDPRCFIIGRTGSGKSAVLRHLEETYPEHVIRISPDSLELSYIANLGLTQYILNSSTRYDPFLKALWKHVLVVDIIQHRYNIDSPEQKLTIMAGLIERFKKSRTKAKAQAKIEALSYVEEWGEKFWSETSERVRQFVDKAEQKASTSGSLQLGVGATGFRGGAGLEYTTSQEDSRKLYMNYQQIVSDPQMARLTTLLEIMNDDILDSEQHFTYIIIDDLDKEWVDEPVANMLIRSLLAAVLDMHKIKNLKIILAIRTNIFQQLGYGSQTRGSQEEKFRGSALHIQWTETGLREVLEQRAVAACKRYGIHPPKSLAEMLPAGPKRNGDPLQYILRLTLLRPRDAITFLNYCVQQAVGAERITWENIYKAEEAYSKDRLYALRDEWKDPYLDIEKAFDKFRRTAYRLSRTDITCIFDDVALLIADPERFRGTAWVNELTAQIYMPGASGKDWYGLYNPLLKLFYRISFLGIAKDKRSDATYVHEDPYLADNPSNLDEATYFEVHPAFRKALNIQSRFMPEQHEDEKVPA